MFLGHGIAIGRFFIKGDVAAFAAMQEILALPAGQFILAGIAEQPVITRLGGAPWAFLH